MADRSALPITRRSCLTRSRRRRLASRERSEAGYKTSRFAVTRIEHRTSAQASARDRSRLGAVVAAGPAVAVAPHCHPPQIGYFWCQPAPDPGGQVLHRGGSEIVDLVEKPMIQTVARLMERLIEQPEVDDHAGYRIGSAADDHFGTVGVAVNPAARLGIHAAVERMRGVEPKLLAEFVHQRSPKNLWVCSDSRQRGCRRQ